MGSPGFRLISQRARIDEYETGKPEIFHHACTEPHVSLVNRGHQHDIDCGHKKLLDSIHGCFQDRGTLVVDRVPDHDRVGIFAHLSRFLR